MLAACRSARSPLFLAAFVAAAMFTTDTIIVAPGDTLSELAEAHDVTVTELVAWNSIADPDLILVGQRLVLGTEDGPSATSQETHTVRAGDTLSALAIRFGTTIRGLVAANELVDADRILVGQVLRLSDRSPSGTAAGGTTYVVRPGDTLLAIARAHQLKTSDLVAANSLADPDRIFVGQRLLIAPAGEAETVPPPTTTTPAPPTTTTPAPPTTTTPAPPTTTTPPAVTGSGGGLAVFFERWSDAYGVDRALLEALLWKESNWRADAVGPGGHLGIGQLSPDTASFVEERLLGLDLDPLDASDGIQMAARYLRYLLDRTLDERTALAAWNQGVHGVNTDGISSAAGRFADDVLEIRRQRAR